MVTPSLPVSVTMHKNAFTLKETKMCWVFFQFPFIFISIFFPEVLLFSTQHNIHLKPDLWDPLLEKMNLLWGDFVNVFNSNLKKLNDFFSLADDWIWRDRGATQEIPTNRKKRWRVIESKKNRIYILNEGLECCSKVCNNLSGFQCCLMCWKQVVNSHGLELP